MSKMENTMIGRIICTVISFCIYGGINAAFAPQATLLAGQAAGRQFQSNDAAYLSTSYLFSILSAAHWMLTLALMAALLLIWFKPVRDILAKITTAIFLLAALAGTDGRAYYDQKDFTEAYTILPNESAFWIPDVGDNKANQAQLDSEDYLKANKLAVKRFIVPHTKLSGTGSFFDFYVPAGRLIIVDRTPFSREWVMGEHRGTSKKDESFPCQTKEGLNIAAGVSIGASVLEANAAKYLYRFGVLPPAGKRIDPQVIFTSVYYSRVLADVMDDVGRKKVQTLVCEEIAGRTFDQANADTNPIMLSVQKKATEYFAGLGITVDFIGWADTFSFDKDVQKVVNDNYAVTKLGPSVAMLQALTQLKVQEGLGVGLATKGLPIVVTPDMIQALVGMVKPPAK